MINCLRKIKRLERLFSDNFYNGSGKTAFNIEEGRIPIMVSAPHAINQFRDGKVKYADMYTGGIAKYLHEKTGCHVIYSCMYTESDPNYDEFEVNKYQHELLEYVNKHNIILLIDIHGAAKERDYAVEMGTAPSPEQLVENEFENPANEDPSLLAALHELGLKEEERVYASMVLGYAATESGLPNRKPLERKGNEVTFI